MWNDLLKVGPLMVHGYGLMIAIGILAAYLTVEYRAKKKGLEYEKIIDLTIWCVIGGVLGAKLLYYITQLNNIIEDPKLLLNVSDGFVIYGGIMGGILTGFLFCKIAKWSFISYFDLVMPSIALAQGFGRLGCFLAGCCYGIETKSPIGIIFHNSDFAPNNVRMVPTQLISSGLDFLNFFILIFLAKRIKAKGQIGGLYLVFYSIGRFIIEFFRGDLERGNIGILSTSQFISILLFLVGAGIVIVSEMKWKKEKDTLIEIE
jgi:phosphatidylglycerol:prolipoprotein diacylglycerol transferase